MVLAYNTNAGAGLASGVDKLADAFLEKKRRQGLASGLEQIQGGDWQGGINTISETDPNTALGLVQYKQRADDAMNLEQMKIAAAEKARNSLTPYQREMLALKKQQIENGGNGTVAQQNIGYLQSLGYSPEEAAALYYSGNNPTLNMENFGKKAQEKFGSETGKNYAEDINAYNNMTSKMPELMDTVSRLNELGQNATYTKGGQILDVIRRETGMSPRQSAVDRASYISMIDNQILPLLRDTFGAQFTEREGNTLRKTLGDANSTPEEKAAQLDAFIRQKQMSIESQKRKLDSYNQPSLADFNGTDSDPLGLR